MTVPATTIMFADEFDACGHPLEILYRLQAKPAFDSYNLGLAVVLLRIEHALWGFS